MTSAAKTIILDLRIADLSNGGVARYAREMGRMLPMFDPSNRYVVIRLNGGEGVETRHETLRIDIRNESRKERDAFLSQIKPLHPDLYHSFWFVPEPADWKRVITVYDSILEMNFPEFQTQGANRRKRLLKKYLPESNGIICISERIKRDIQSFYHLVDTPMAVTHLAAALPGNPTSWPKLSARLGIKTPFIFFSGHSLHVGYKNFSNLLRAFSFLKHRNLQLVVSGKKPDLSSRFLDLTRDLYIQDRLIFTDFLDDADLFTVLRNASLMVYPSLYEGFGLPLLEAMSAHVPVAASREGAIPEIAGDAAAYFDPLDPFDMARVLQDVLINLPLRKKLIGHGKVRIKAFSWKKTATQTLSFYRHLFEEHHDAVQAPGAGCDGYPS